MPLYTPATGGTDMATEYTDTAPATPTRGLVIFTRRRSRRLPAAVGPSGLDTILQPALFSNRISRWNAINNSTTTSVDSMAVTTAGTGTGVANAGSSFFNGMVRERWSTGTTAGTVAGMRAATNQWFLSSTANLGGVFMVARLGVQAVSSTTQARWFVGMSSSTANLAVATTDPTAMTNLFGFGANAADTNMRFLSNDGTGTATSVDLGANFPAKTAATWFYQFEVFAPSGAGLNVQWAVVRLNDGLVAMSSTPVTTDLPAVSTMLASHIAIGNGTSAASSTFDIQNLYMESDN